MNTPVKEDAKDRFSIMTTPGQDHVSILMSNDNDDDGRRDASVLALDETLQMLQVEDGDYDDKVRSEQLELEQKKQRDFEEIQKDRADKLKKIKELEQGFFFFFDDIIMFLFFFKSYLVSLSLRSPQKKEVGCCGLC